MTPSFPCPLAAILPADPARFVPAVAHAAALGFTHIEAAALADRPAGHLDALADAGLIVACAMLSGAVGADPVPVPPCLARTVAASGGRRRLARRNVRRPDARGVCDASRRNSLQRTLHLAGAACGRANGAAGDSPHAGNAPAGRPGGAGMAGADERQPSRPGRGRRRPVGGADGRRKVVPRAFAQSNMALAPTLAAIGYRGVVGVIPDQSPHTSSRTSSAT